MKQFGYGVMIGCVAALMALSACSKGNRGAGSDLTTSQDEPETNVTIQKTSFGSTPGGHDAHLYTLTNAKGARAVITDYGATVVELWMPDRKGNLSDIVLGFDSLNAYVKDNPYFGCIVGRYGNRIAKGQFTLNGTKYELAKNNGENHLHGGEQGFDKKVWAAKIIDRNGAPGLILTLVSPDGDEGYPGTLTVNVTYVLTDHNELVVEYEALSDADTVVNLTHHSYFNLAGAGNGDILKHELMINADRFTPVDETLIPTGELRPVFDTPFDFLKATPIGARIEAEDEQIRYGKGYDHNYVLNGERDALTLAARVTEPGSGRVMEIHTTEPGMQLYTGNFLDGSAVGKGNVAYGHRTGFCLETQRFPDSPNQPLFPTTTLKKNDYYRSTTIHRFSTL